MREDFSAPAPAKEGSRQGTLDLVREHSNLLWSRKESTLRYDWVELSGRMAPTLALLLEQQALTRSRFIGVDISRPVIDECNQHYADHLAAGRACWIEGNLITLLQDRARFENTGVLVYDSFDGAHGRKAMSNLDVLLTFAREQQERLSEFLLVINVVAQRTTDFSDFESMIQRHVPGVVLTPESYAPYEGRKHTQMLLTRIRFGF